VTIAARLRSYGSTTTVRIVGVDIARGVAVLGMYGAHIGVTEAFDWGQPATWLDLVHGRSSILFALLAGVSIAILSGRREPLAGVPLLQARVRILVRAALIFAIGGLLEFLGTNIAVILHVYAALFVLSLPFLRWSSRRLFIAAAAVAIVMPLLLHSLAPGGFGPDVFLGGGVIVDLLFFGTYPGAIWIAFVFTGMAIGRLDIANLRVQLRLLVVGALLATVAYTVGGLGSQLISPEIDGGSSGSSGSSSSYPDIVTVPFGEVPDSGMLCDDYGDGTFYCYPENIDESVTSTDDGVYDEGVEKGVDWTIAFDYSSLVSIDAHSGTPFEVIGSGGFAMAVLALSLLAARRRVIRWVLYPIAAVGAMALTAYSVHVVVIFALGSGFAFAYADNWLYLWFVLGALVVCTTWTTLVGRGPLEQVLTRVSRQTAALVPAPPTTPSPDTPASPEETTEKPHD
jgi:uncharacterized protein